MNNFYKIIELVRARLAENPMVNTLIFARVEEKDLYKKNLYPLAHIIPQASPWTTQQVNQVSLQIRVVEQRDINKMHTDTKFEGNDNILDNLNVTHTIINDLLTYLSLQNNDDYIELINVSNLEPILFSDHNILDGWGVTITLSIPNSISVC
jgi:predicted glycosyltransferase